MVGGDGKRVAELGVVWPVLIILAALGFLWWRREIGSRRQREKLRIIYHLGEEILSAASSAEIPHKVALALPRVLPLTGAKLYLYDRGTKSLHRVGEPQDSGISIDSPSGLTQPSPVPCFHT